MTKACRQCGIVQHSIGYWHNDTFIKTLDDNFDDAPSAYQRIAEHNQNNPPLKWVVVLIANNDLCQRCNYLELVKQAHIIEPKAKQLALF